MKILITGATGFIGNNLVEYLESKKYIVFGISRSKTDKKIKNISLDDETKLKNYFKKNKFDVVIHLSSTLNNDNPKTVQAMDLLVPYIGELIGSSVREDNYEILIDNMKNKKINIKPLKWYVDLRNNGTWRHAGAGLGFERLVGMVTMNNNFNKKVLLLNQYFSY